MIPISEDTARQLLSGIDRLSALLAGVGVPTTTPAVSSIIGNSNTRAKQRKEVLKQQSIEQLAKHLGPKILNYLKP